MEILKAGFTFANALESVPEASVAAVVETTGDTKLLMTAELVLVLEVIERLLGGTGDGSIAELSGVGREVKAVIDFDDESVGRKTIKLAYTTLERGQE